MGCCQTRWCCPWQSWARVAYRALRWWWWSCGSGNTWFWTLSGATFPLSHSLTCAPLLRMRSLLVWHISCLARYSSACPWTTASQIPIPCTIQKLCAYFSSFNAISTTKLEACLHWLEKITKAKQIKGKIDKLWKDMQSHNSVARHGMVSLLLKWRVKELLYISLIEAPTIWESITC